MKLDSPWFSKIRCTAKAARGAGTGAPVCEHVGCREPGGFRAPKGRDREGEYWNFCFEHVRAYNQGYNYFVDMPDEAVAAWQKDALTGHRPTWTMGANPGTRSGRARAETPRWGAFRFSDPFGLGDGDARDHAHAPGEPERREIRNAERKSLQELGLDGRASAADIKAAFKTLVKRLHPDANGGDRSTEGKLRAVIQAYNYLKQAGFC